MPNYDLGTARGRIKVDSDTRGARLADRALQSFEKTVRALSGKMSQFENHMNAMERELDTAARDFEKTGRAAHGYEKGVRDADRSTRQFSQNVAELHSRLRGLNHATEVLLPPSLQLLRVWREYSKTDGGFINLVRGIHRAGGTSAILTMLTGRFIGMGAAINSLTGRSRQVVQFASGFRTFSFIAGTIGAAAAKLGLFEKVFGRLVRNTIEGDHALLGMRNAMERFSRPISNVIRNLDRLALGTIQFTGGLALMRRGFQQLSARFSGLTGLLRGMPPWMKLAAGAAVVFSQALTQILAKALVTVSNLLVDIAAAGKQLAGGFLAIPGGIAMAVTAFGTLKAIIAPMKKQFQDLMKAIGEGDQAAIGEALAKLPEHLKPLGQVIAEILPQWLKMRDALQATFVGGADVQLRALSERYLPAISRGASMVANSWRMAKDQVVAFLSESQTVSDTQRLFMNTSQTMNNFKDSIRPVLEGFRDLAIVGSEFLRNLSAGLPDIAQKFADWARINRENGNLFKWMTDAWRGTKQLVSGLVDAGKATWTLLTLFKDRSGEGSLKRFADAMERFNNAVQKSAAGGVLKQVGDAVRNMGTDKIRELWDILKSLGKALKDVLPFITDIAAGFRTIMLPAVKATIEIVRQIIEQLNKFGGGQMIGWVLGLVGAFKLFGTVFGPLRNIIQITVGAFTGFKGAQNLILGLMGTLENFGGVGKRVSNAIGSIGDSLARWGTIAAGAALGIVAFYAGFTQGASDIKRADQAIADAAKHTNEFGDALASAFESDRGLTGKTVFDTVTQQINTMMSDLSAQADAMPGMAATFNDQIGNLFETGKGISQQWNELWGPSERLQGLQNAAESAEKAKGAFDRLGISNENLAAIVSGSESNFRNQVDAIRASGDGGEEAANKLEQLHAKFTGIQHDFEVAGPGAAILAQGIEKIATAGGDADTKLEGLKLALQGLGLDKTSQYENAIALAEAVNKIANEAATAADKSQSMADIWGPNGEINAGASANANNLLNLLIPAMEQFKRSVAQPGADVGAAFKKIQDQVPALAAAFTPVGGNVQDTINKINDLISTLGGVPDTVKILMQLEGKDKITRGLGELYTQLQTAGLNVPVNVIMKDPASVEAELDKALGPVLDDLTTHTDTMLQIKPGLDQAAMDRIAALLATHGIQLPGGPAPAPATVPVKPGAPPPGAPPPPPAAAPAAAPVDQAALDRAKQQIGELQAKIAELQKATPNGRIEFTIIAKGYDETVAVVNRVKDSITAMINEVNKIPSAFAQAFSQAMYTLATTAQQMQTAGQTMMNDLAQGIRDGTASQVIPAVDAMLQEIKDRTPHSPPKKGPLSGSNYVDQSGYAVSSDFASGIVSGYPVAGKAADGLMGKVSDSMQERPFLGQLKELLQFGQNIKGMFDKISGIFFNFAKFISDPLGKGTFFGQSTGAAFGFRRDPNVSDADLRRKREDEELSRKQSAEQDRKDRAAGGGAQQVDVNASKEEIATAIAAEAFARGYDRNTAIGAVSAAMLESGLDAGVTNATGHESLFQTSADKKVGKDPNAQIKWFFDQMDKLGGPGAVGNDPLSFIADKIEKGGYPGSDYQKFTSQAAGLVDAVKSQTDATKTNTKVTSDLPSSLTVTGRQGLKPAAENLLEVIAQNFPEVANIGGKRADPLPDHPAGRALDIMIGKNMELGDQINKFLRDNAQALGIHSTIWRDTWQDMEGNSSRVAGHMDHIHARVLETANAFDNSLIGTTPGVGGKGNDTETAMLDELRKQTPLLDNAIKTGQDPNSTDEQVASSLQLIQQSIDKQAAIDTPEARQQTSALESIKSTIASDRGMAEAPNPMDQAANIVSGISSIAGSIFEVINATIEAIAATRDLVDYGIRYPENTEDIMKMIDDFQKYIELGSAIAGATSAILGAAGSMTGGMDMGGVAAAGQAAAMIQAALEAINAGIDLAQEAWHIFGSYFGDFLGILAGGAGGPLQGNVKFLLDQNAGQLYAYGQDNPMDKRGHNVPGMIAGPEFQQGIGQVNVFGGPGSDPRDNTRQMMFQVKAAGFAGATGQ